MKYYIFKKSSNTIGWDLFPTGETINYQLNAESLSIPQDLEKGSMVIGYLGSPKDKFNSLYKLKNVSEQTLTFEKEFEINSGIGTSEIREEVRALLDSDHSGIFEIEQSDFESICLSMFQIASLDFIRKPYENQNGKSNDSYVEFSAMSPEQRRQMYEDFIDRLENSASAKRRYKKSMLCNETNNAVKECCENLNSVYEIDNLELLEKCKEKLRPKDGVRINNGFPLTAIGYYINLIDNYDSKQTKAESEIKKSWEQVIYFGAPGSGKSFEVKRILEKEKLEKFKEDDKQHHIIRTTFHPDSDYSTFVGAYKPYIELIINDEGNEEKKITYKFVPQAFTDIYVKAWQDTSNPYYLVIEEINRGNCAQIFGDLFQLLDRNSETGMSDYKIIPNVDLKEYLLKVLGENSLGIKDGMQLPPNLSIYATMNTSDQSLFPMDTAFKRRWAWEYVPIDYNNEESGTFTITLGNKEYRWHDFLKIINKKIKKVTSSEDKQMGNFFIKHSVDEKEFKDKVMFYLWSEVGKDNYQTNDAIFYCYKEGTQDKVEFSFNELYPVGTKKLQDFMDILEVNSIDTDVNA